MLQAFDFFLQELELLAVSDWKGVRFARALPVARSPKVSDRYLTMNLACKVSIYQGEILT